MAEDILDEFIAKHKSHADEYTAIIERMLGDYDAYHYAEDTLLNILGYIEENDIITDGQIQAIENIKSHPSKPRYV